MGELEIRLPSGGVATVKGTPAEIAEVLRLAGLSAGSPSVGAAPTDLGAQSRRRSAEKNTKRGAARPHRLGPRGRVESLLAEGFFKTKRTLADLRDRLKQDGHVYKATDLSPVLIRLVRDRHLRRSKGESGHWAYGEW